MDETFDFCFAHGVLLRDEKALLSFPPLGVGIMCVDKYVVVEALLVLVCWHSGSFLLCGAGPSLVHILEDIRE